VQTLLPFGNKVKCVTNSCESGSSVSDPSKIPGKSSFGCEAAHLGRLTSSSEVINSSVGLVPTNAPALTKPPYFSHLEFDCVDCWERLGKELKVSKHQVNRTESTGHMSLVRAHNPKVVSSNLTPATILTDSQGLVGLHQQAPLLFGKDLGKKSLFPRQSQAIQCRKVHQVFLRRSVHHR